MIGVVFSISKAIVSIVVGVIVWLVFTYLLGPALETLQFSLAVIVGKFLVQFGELLGVLAAIWYYFRGPALV